MSQHSIRILEIKRVLTFTNLIVRVAAFSVIFVSFVWSGEPTYFRSDQGVAGDDDQPLPHEFGEKNQIWRTPIGQGLSTPCVVGDRIFLTTFDQEKEKLATVCLDRAKGTVQWKQVAPVKKIEQVHRTGNPAASSPASDGERVYSFFGSYGLLCYDHDGDLLWKRAMGPFQDEFGAASSPVLVDDKVVLNEDHDVDSHLLALNKLTGEIAWRVSRDGQTRSYSTPIVWSSGGKKQLIVAGALQLAAYDVKTGEKKWWANGLSRILDTTPLLVDGIVYVATWTPGGDPTQRIAMEPYAEATSEYDKNGDGLIAKTELPPGAVLTRFFRIDLDQDEKLNEDEWNKHRRVFELAQNVALAIKPGGEGDVTKTGIRWTARRGLPTVPSPVVYRGIVYMVKDGGIITSLDAMTGEITKRGRAEGRGNYYASAVAGDGKVYLTSESGVISVLKAAAEWEILASHDFGERILATPVISGAEMFIRTDEAIYCVRN